MKAAVSLCALQLVLAMSVSEANYEFTIRFYEFRNPLGLQCGECGSGGPPACCDDVQRTESCVNEANGPLRCDTRFRFLLRSFGASVDTAPSRGFPYYNAGNIMPNSINFTGGFVNLPNPFTITNESEWMGRVQFFIDALDRDVPHRRPNETEAIINRFLIDLELELGAAFTERTTYTGIYNISGLGFDMSFRVQCSENYYGPNCTTFCEPMEGVYTCDSEGRVICMQSSRDPATNCTTCLNSVHLDPSTNCRECLFRGQDPATNCTSCLPDFSGGGGAEPDVALLAGAVGGAGGILIIVLLVLCAVIVCIMKVKKKGRYYSKKTNEDTNDDSSINLHNLQLQMTTAADDTSTHDHDFSNRLYAEPVKDSATEAKNGNQTRSPSAGVGNGVNVPMEYECPQDRQQLDVPNPYYGEVGENTDQASASAGSERNSPSHDQQTRKNTFPYVMEEKPASDSTTNQPAPHMYQNVHGICAAVDKPSGKGATITMTTHSEYDVVERCNTTSSILPAVPRFKSSSDAPAYSLSSEPAEGEVYNVAYPVLTPKMENSVAVDGYECLLNVLTIQ